MQSFFRPRKTDDYEHWWEAASYLEEARAAEKNSITQASWHLSEAVAFAYELVRRLALCRHVRLTDHERSLICELPKKTVLNADESQEIKNALLRHWKVRPLAYWYVVGLKPVQTRPGYVQPPILFDLSARFAAIRKLVRLWYDEERRIRKIEGGHRKRNKASEGESKKPAAHSCDSQNHDRKHKGYAQIPFLLDPTAAFDRIVKVVKAWYYEQPQNIRVRGGKQGVVPFRVTWARISLLESPYGKEANRPRDRAIELARRCLKPVLKAWENVQHPEYHVNKIKLMMAVHEYAKAKNFGPLTDWYDEIWKEGKLSKELRPTRDPDKGMD